MSVSAHTYLHSVLCSMLHVISVSSSVPLLLATAETVLLLLQITVPIARGRCCGGSCWGSCWGCCHSHGKGSLPHAGKAWSCHAKGDSTPHGPQPTGPLQSKLSHGSGVLICKLNVLSRHLLDVWLVWITFHCHFGIILQTESCRQVLFVDKEV